MVNGTVEAAMLLVPNANGRSSILKHDGKVVAASVTAFRREGWKVRAKGSYLLRVDISAESYFFTLDIVFDQTETVAGQEVYSQPYVASARLAETHQREADRLNASRVNAQASSFRHSGPFSSCWVAMASA